VGGGGDAARIHLTSYKGAHIGHGGSPFVSVLFFGRSQLFSFGGSQVYFYLIIIIYIIIIYIIYDDDIYI